MLAADAHCPECHSVTIDLIFVKPDRLVKRCTECKHKWNEPRFGALTTDLSPNYINRDLFTVYE